VIDDALFETINQRADIVLSSCSATGEPSLCWGMAGRLLDDRRTVQAWVREDQARQFLADVRATGRVVQLKGGGGSVRAASREDEPFLRLHVDHMVQALARVNFNEVFARNFFDQPWTMLAVVSFAATQVFVQTPGPRAGSR
jgi:hypothetical protein